LNNPVNPENPVILSISPALAAACTGVALGVLTCSAVVSERDDELWTAIAARVAELETLLATTDVQSIPEIAATRRAYKALGKDPSRYRGSAEAMVRRIAQGKGLYQVNSVVDVNNLVSLETFHSIGLYDRRFIGREIEFRAGREGESYPGIGKGDINVANLPLFADADGPFGNPSSDSARSMVRADTTELLMVIIAFSGASHLDAALDRAADLLARHCSGTSISPRVVS
jgi:DNA/RNA-binding domain of Phe-tRNA-synthetase-like protein